MTSYKATAFIALIALAFGVALVGDALAGEKGKMARRNANFVKTAYAVKVGDVEGHNFYLFEVKTISFNQKWGVGQVILTGTCDDMKGEGTYQGYEYYTFPDGSITDKWEGKYDASGGKGTYTHIKGTGKFEGIQGRGTWKSHLLGPDQNYSDAEGEYTLP